MKDTLGFSTSDSTMKRLLKSLGFVYKRMQLSCSHKRDEQMFDFFKEEIKHLHAMEDSGRIDLYSFDVMGVNLSPVVTYGWQAKGETHKLSSLPSKDHTVVGFVNRACKFHVFIINGAATADTTIACMNE